MVPPLFEVVAPNARTRGHGLPSVNRSECAAAFPHAGSVPTPMAAATRQSRLRAMNMFAELSRELRPPLTAEAAVIEADRCLECGGGAAPAPCVVGCPADVDVPGFVAAIAAGDPARGRATIFAENILGGTCARVCPVEVLCQRDCVLVHEGRRPIEIGALQRYATEWAYANGVPLRVRRPPNGKRVAVVGAGPAGLAAAGELAARGYAVTVYDERTEVGRTRPLRDRAVPPDERAAARRGAAAGRARRRVPAAHAHRRGAAGRAERGGRRDRPRRRDGRGRRRRRTRATTSRASGSRSRSSST